MTTDRRRLLRILASPNSAVYPGRYVTCVYNPDKALCRTRIGADNDTPDQSNCKPLTCRNTALTDENLNIWHEELATITRDLSSTQASPHC